MIETVVMAIATREIPRNTMMAVVMVDIMIPTTVLRMMIKITFTTMTKDMNDWKSVKNMKSSNDKNNNDNNDNSSKNNTNDSNNNYHVVDIDYSDDDSHDIIMTKYSYDGNNRNNDGNSRCHHSDKTRNINNDSSNHDSTGNHNNDFNKMKSCMTFITFSELTIEFFFRVACTCRRALEWATKNKWSRAVTPIPKLLNKINGNLPEGSPLVRRIIQLEIGLPTVCRSTHPKRRRERASLENRRKDAAKDHLLDARPPISL